MKPIAIILAAAVIALGIFVLNVSGPRAATDPRASIGPRAIGNAELLALQNLNQVMNTFVQIANAQLAIAQREVAALEQANVLKSQEHVLKSQELSMEAMRIDLGTFNVCQTLRYHDRGPGDPAIMAHWVGLDCASRTGLSLWAQGPQPAAIP